MARKGRRARLAPANPPLVSKRVYLAMRIGARVYNTDVRALVIGNWALHDTAGGDASDAEEFSVTHIPSGRSLNGVAGGISLWDAVDIVSALAAHVPDLEYQGDDAWLSLSIIAEIIGESKA